MDLDGGRRRREEVYVYDNGDDYDSESIFRYVVRFKPCFKILDYVFLN